MAEDLGGLRYPIRVDDHFSAAMDSLLEKIEQVKAGFAGLASLGPKLQSLSKASSDAERSSRRRAEALTLEQKAIQAKNKDLERRFVNFRKEILLAEQGIQSERALTQARRDSIARTREQERASRDAARAKNAEVLAEERLRETILEGTREFQRAAASARQEELKNLRNDIKRRLGAEQAAADEQVKIDEKIEVARRRGFDRLRALEEEQSRRRKKALDESVEGQADARIVAAQRRLAIAQEIVRRAQAGVQIPPGEVARAQKEIKALNDELGRTQATGNRISFTFRRLFGILALFTIARKLLEGLKDIVLEAIRFNAEIEKANVGIASLILSVGDVRSSTGQAAEGAEAFSIALKEARRQTALLRADSFRTAASIQELQKTFQVALAPGLRAGFNLDQIRKLTVEISQAAAAIDLPQQQLAEEIRSILDGTIQLRTTRIAAALGITNEDVRRAKDLGIFAEFLNEKFSAFSEAAKEAVNTFDLLLANLKKSFDAVVGAAGKEFFEELKNLLRNAQSAFARVGQGGILEVNPAIVNILKAAFDVLANIVRTVSQIAGDKGFQNLLTAAGQFSRVLGLIQKQITSIFTVGFLSSPLLLAFRLIPTRFLDGMENAVTNAHVLFVRLGASIQTLFLRITHEVRNTIASNIGALITTFAPVVGLLGTILGPESEAEFKAKLETIEKDAEATIRKIRDEARAASPFIDLLEGLPAVLGGARRELEQQGSIARDLADALIEVQIELNGVKRGLGVEGAALQEIQELTRAQVEFQQKSKELAQQEADALDRQADNARTLQGIRDRIARSTQDEQEFIQSTITTIREIGRLRQERANEDARAQDLEIKRLAAIRRGSDEEAITLAIRRDEAKESARLLAADIERAEAAALVQTKSVEQAEALKKLRDLAQQVVTLEAQGVAVSDELNGILSDRSRLETDINKLARDRIRQIALQETEALRRSNLELAQRTAAEIRLQQIRRSFSEVFSNAPLREQLALTRNLVNEEQRRSLTAIEIAKNEKAAIDDSIRTLQTKINEEGTQGKLLELFEQQRAKQEEINLLQEDNSVRVGDIVKQFETLTEASRTLEGQIRLGLSSAFANFVKAAPDVFQTIQGLATTTLEGIVQIGRGLFASIFDPQSNFSIREALGRLALQLGEDLFEAAIRNLIAGISFESAARETSAITAATTLKLAADYEATARITSAQIAAGILTAGGIAEGAAGAAGGNPISFFAEKGGRVPESARASPAHYSRRARGFSIGGKPAGIPASDNVPAWLTEGEWVMQLRSVRRYGETVMDSINRGLVDPVLLRSIASTSGRRAPRVSAGVAPAALALANGGPVARGTGGSSGPIVLPAVTVNSETMNQLLNARGAEGMLTRWLAEHGYLPK